VLDAPPPVDRTARFPRLGSVPAYAAAVVVTVVAILSQYFVPQSVPGAVPIYSNFFGDLFVVYGVPILAFALLVGARPLAGYVENMGRAVVQGLAWFGALSILTIGVVVGLVIVYLALDPSALQLLNNTTPPIANARSDVWFWVAFSFVVGVIEETIFRGWIFGYTLVKDPNRWVLHATWTSALFAAVHLYYATTYGIATPLIAPDLFFLGFAFAATMRASGGNVLVVGILHGMYDAISFYSLVNDTGAVALHYLAILIGVTVAVVLYLRSRPAALAPPPTVWRAAPPADPYALLAPPQWVPPPPPAPPAPPSAPPSSPDPGG
jgi:membrane protease YdiL (CAAX protease family)